VLRILNWLLIAVFSDPDNFVETSDENTNQTMNVIDTELSRLFYLTVNRRFANEVDAIHIFREDEFHRTTVRAVRVVLANLYVASATGSCDSAEAAN
jgi:hypothetical protein